MLKKYAVNTFKLFNVLSFIPYFNSHNNNNNNNDGKTNQVYTICNRQ